MGVRRWRIKGQYGKTGKNLNKDSDSSKRAPNFFGSHIHGRRSLTFLRAFVPPAPRNCGIPKLQ
jgi:hypothetical protein